MANVPEYELEEYWPCKECTATRDSAGCSDILKEYGYTQDEEGCGRKNS